MGHHSEHSVESQVQQDIDKQGKQVRDLELEASARELRHEFLKGRKERIRDGVDEVFEATPFTRAQQLEQDLQTDE